MVVSLDQLAFKFVILITLKKFLESLNLPYCNSMNPSSLTDPPHRAIVIPQHKGPLLWPMSAQLDWAVGVFFQIKKKNVYLGN